MAVREPFAFGPPRRYPLRRIAHDSGAALAQDSLAWVEPDAQVVHTTEGRRVEYDALLIGIGFLIMVFRLPWETAKATKRSPSPTTKVAAGTA